MNEAIHAEEVKRHIQCCIDTDECILCSFFKEGCDKGTFAKLMLTAVKQLERERDAAVEEIFQTCCNCKHEKLGYGVGPCPPIEEYVKTTDCSNWQWRGVEVERWT